MSKQQLFELADRQEKENNELPAEIDHPPGRIWRVRTRRYKKSAASNEEKQDDKERFNNESSSDSDDSLMPAAKIEAAEESSHNSSDDGDVDGDVSMLSPLERKAKTKAREKITEIVNAGKRPRKQKPADQTRASVIRAASVDSQQKESQSVHEEPKASNSDASLEEYTLHLVAQKSDIATSSGLYSRSQESQGVLQTASANMQPLHDDYDSSQNKAIHEETVGTKTQEHARRSFPEFAREMSAKLRVDLRENVAANKRGLRIDVWEVDSDEEQSQNKKGPVRDAQISDIKIANANVQSNNDNDAVASNEIFEALQSQTWADYDLDNAQISSDARQLRGYSEQQECADTSATLIRSDDIPSKPPGNCLFYSLIKILDLDMTATELRRLLLQSPFLESCNNPREARAILASPSEWGNINCVYIFAHTNLGRNATCIAKRRKFFCAIVICISSQLESFTGPLHPNLGRVTWDTGGPHQVTGAYVMRDERSSAARSAERAAEQTSGAASGPTHKDALLGNARPPPPAPAYINRRAAAVRGFGSGQSERYIVSTRVPVAIREQRLGPPAPWTIAPELSISPFTAPASGTSGNSSQAGQHHQEGHLENGEKYHGATISKMQVFI
ncbi:unnamed protein product [Trichogramma brassicae]|uniref:Uncharacterized protein n=1 Tax=Trichogramma brassicae TaxID=86971 RepID=A0A6H5J6V5_9HYME|nr:unnamed protein product [Trichogramma brassicae]